MGLDIYFIKTKKRSEEVGYFRKVNFLVNFFENTKHEEIQNCEPIQVSKEDVLDLKNKCEIVLADHSKAEEFLPTVSGFFFGSTEYDDYYFENVYSVLNYINKTLLPQFDNLEEDECIEFSIWY